MNIIKYLYEHPFDINKPTSFIESRSRLLMLLHEIVRNMNHEEAYMEWISNDIPDCPDVDVFEDLAQDDDTFWEILNDFTAIFGYYKQWE